MLLFSNLSNSFHYTVVILWLAFMTTLWDFLAIGSIALRKQIIGSLPRRNYKSGSNSNAVEWRDLHRGIKQKMLRRFLRRARLRKKEANKGRSRLPRRLRDTFEKHRSFIGRNVLVPSSVFFFYTTSAPTSSSSSAHGMADQNVAVKKADPLPRPSCPSFSSPSSFPFSPHRTTNERPTKCQP